MRMSRCTAFVLPVALMLTIGCGRPNATVPKTAAGGATLRSKRQGGAISARDARGSVVSLRERPRRIVSLAPAVTEILFAVGAGDSVVGVTAYCDYPDAAKRIPRVGDLNVSAEKVLALKPDLVIADLEANRKAIAALEQIGTLRGRVFVIAGKHFKNIMDAVGLVGTLTGHEALASRTISRMKQTLTEIRQRTQSQRIRPRAVFVVQVAPLWVAGGDTFIDDLITAAGGDNVGRLAGDGYRAFSLERLIVADPDHIVSSDAKPGGLRKRAGWRDMTAVKQGRVHVLGYDAVRPGPRLAEAVAQLNRILFASP